LMRTIATLHITFTIEDTRKNNFNKLKLMTSVAGR